MSHVDLEHAVGYALKRATTALRAAMDAELRAHDLSVPQYACLELLAQRPGLSSAELARGAFVSRQAMHQLLGGLRAAGLVTGDGQRRGQRLALTAAGAERLARASQAVAAVEDGMLASLTAPERERLHSALSTCADALTGTKRTSPQR